MRVPCRRSRRCKARQSMKMVDSKNEEYGVANVDGGRVMYNNRGLRSLGLPGR